MSNYETVKYTSKDRVAIITIHRPDAMNSFNRILRADLLAACQRASDDSAVRVVVLTGEGRSFSAGDTKKAIFEQNRAMEAALLLTLPAAVALFLLPYELITVLFQRGEFDAFDTLATSWALMAYVIGLPAYVMVKVLTPGFYSRKDTATPVKFALISVGVNVVLNVILMQFLFHVGLALATAIASWLNVTLLYLALVKRGHFKLDKRLRQKIARIALSCLVMGLGVWGAAYLLSPYFGAGTLEGGLALALVVFFGLLLYGAVAHLTGAISMAEARQLFSRQGPRE